MVLFQLPAGHYYRYYELTTTTQIVGNFQLV